MACFSASLPGEVHCSVKVVIARQAVVGVKRENSNSGDPEIAGLKYFQSVCITSKLANSGHYNYFQACFQVVRLKRLRTVLGDSCEIAVLQGGCNNSAWLMTRNSRKSRPPYAPLRTEWFWVVLAKTTLLSSPECAKKKASTKAGALFRCGQKRQHDVHDVHDEERSCRHAMSYIFNM